MREETCCGYDKKMILFSTLLFVLLLKTESKTPEAGCQFPSEWEGIWFQSTVRPYIKIDATSISSKGHCTRTDPRGEKFLIQESKKCYKCIVMYQKHRNVLQYKETVRCSKRNDLHRVCSEIPGDANLYTLFRVDGHPIDCPFGTQHGFRFSYNRGKGDCQWPESELEPCTDAKRLVLNYQACPNVQGSELMSEKLECQAAWKDGSRHFMVGKLDHPHATNDEDKFRCFVYEYKDPLRPSEGIYLAQSGDATCNGLFSPHEGSRTLKLKKAPSKIGCTFPRWMQEKKSWATIDGALIWKFATSANGNSTWMNMTTVSNNNFGAISSYVHHEQSLVWCHSIPKKDTIILYQTKGCTSGFVCAKIRQITSQVIQVQHGSLTRTLEYACDQSQFRGSEESLLLSNSQKVIQEKEEKLPSGLFHINGDPSLLTGHQKQQMSAAVRADFHESNPGGSKNNQLCQDGATSKVISVILGCASKTHSDLQIRSSCSEDLVDFPKEYENTHLWSENGTDFRVYKPLKKESSSGICLAFIKDQENLKVKKLDINCKEPKNPQKRSVSSKSEDISLIFQGQCSMVTSGASFLQENYRVFMILFNLSLFHFCFW